MDHQFSAIQIEINTYHVSISETQRASKLFTERKHLWDNGAIYEVVQNWIVFPNTASIIDKHAPEYILVKSPTNSRQDVALFKELCAIFGSSLKTIYNLGYNDAKQGGTPRI